MRKEVHSKTKLAIPVLASLLIFTSCSSSLKSSSLQPFDKNNVKSGQRYTWKGTVSEPNAFGKNLVLVDSEEDNLGNKLVVFAVLDSVTLPPKGTEIVFDGVLQAGVITGTDYHYLPDGFRTGIESKYLSLTDCHIH